MLWGMFPLLAASVNEACFTQFYTCHKNDHVEINFEAFFNDLIIDRSQLLFDGDLFGVFIQLFLSGPIYDKKMSSIGHRDWPIAKYN